MEQEKYLISWKTFQPHLRNSVNNLFTDKLFADVTLVSDDEIQVSAHKFVLSACSPMLKSLLINHPHPHPMLYLRGVSHEQLEYLLSLCTKGRSVLIKTELNTFLK